MDIRQSGKGLIFTVKVNPSSGRFRLYTKGGKLFLDIKGKPEKGYANTEVVRGLGKLFGREVEIVRGHSSRDKLILVKGISMEAFENVL